MKQAWKSFFLLMFALAILCFASRVATAQTASVALNATQFSLNRLAPGQTSSNAAFQVDDATAIAIEITATTDTLTVTIAGPHGESLDANSVASFGGTFAAIPGTSQPDFAFLLASSRPDSHYLFNFPSLGAGTYTVQFVADPLLTTDVPVLTQFQTDSSLATSLIVTTPVVFSGDSAVLTAAAFDGSSPAPGATMIVTILAPDQTITTLPLKDDGIVADDKAGDGLYSGEFVPSQPGKYSALATISGTRLNGVPYSRHAATEFTVISRPSFLTGTITDAPIDDNGDSFIDRVAFTIGTQTAIPGTYRAFVHLSAASGRKFFDSGQGDLQSGSGTLQVSFAADDFLAIGEDGPYNIESVELVLLDHAGSVPSGTLTGLGQTKAYHLSQFQRDPIILTGVTSDQGLDTNGNGKFDLLQTTVQVNVLFPGFYSWNMQLTDQNGNEIGFFSNDGFLNAGLNDVPFVFDGSRIGLSGVDGPFRMSSLLLFGPASIVVPDAGQTRSYVSLQFENGRATDTTPPVTTASVTPAPNGNGWNNSDVTIVLHATDSEPGGTGVKQIQFTAGGAQSGSGTAPGDSASLTISVEGTTTVTYFATDNAGNQEVAHTLTIRLDKTPPAISGLPLPNSCVLWPPNHKLVNVATVSGSDALSGLVSFNLTGTSSEPQDPNSDVVIAESGLQSRSVQLRAERLGNGAGRVYTLQASAADLAGNVTTAAATCSVPHDQGK